MTVPILSRPKQLLKDNPRLRYLFLFTVATLLFFFIQSAAAFPDPDSFYHAKMAVLMNQQGIIKEFPYARFTVLNDVYADHHLLYHAALMPFTAVLPPLVGTKVATIVFAALMITALYWFLRSQHVAGSWFYCLVAMVSASFIFRLNLAKAQGLALIMFFVILSFLYQKKVIPLLVAAFAYVWLYGGWPLFLVAWASCVGADLLKGLSFEPPHESAAKKIFPAVMYHRIGWSAQTLRSDLRLHSRQLAAILAGLALGTVLNPYFPNNLFFYWNQIFKIAVVNYRTVIGVGSEWYPYGPFELMTSASLAFIVGLVALTFFILNFKNQTRASLSLFLLTIFFYGLTLKSRRNVEYLIPAMLAFSGLSLTQFAKTVKIRSFFSELATFFSQQKILFAVALIPLAMIPYVVGRDVWHTRKQFQAGLEYTKFEAAARWLADHSQAGELVFHSDWDEFPLLFFHNSHNRYIVGLDPTFMYEHSQDLYWKWQRITVGDEVEGIYPIIKNDFGAKYVFISLGRHSKMETHFENNFLFEKVFEDAEARVYRVL